MMRSVFLTPFCKVLAADFFVDKRVTNTYSMIRYAWNRISVFHPKRKRSCFSGAILIAMVIICPKAKICGFSYMILLLCPFRRIYDIHVYIIRNEQVNMYSWIFSFIYTRQYFTNASVCTHICDARLSLAIGVFQYFLLIWQLVNIVIEPRLKQIAIRWFYISKLHQGTILSKWLNRH